MGTSTFPFKHLLFVVCLTLAFAGIVGTAEKGHEDGDGSYFFSCTDYPTTGHFVHLSRTGSVLASATFPVCGTDDCRNDFALGSTLVPITNNDFAMFILLRDINDFKKKKLYETTFTFNPQLSLTTRKVFTPSFQISGFPYFQSFHGQDPETPKYRIGYSFDGANGLSLRSAVANPNIGKLSGPFTNIFQYSKGDIVDGAGVDYAGTRGWGTVYNQLPNNTVSSFLYTLPLKTGKPSGVFQEILLFNKPDVGTRYTIIGAADISDQIPASPSDPNPHRFFCSRTMLRDDTKFSSQIVFRKFDEDLALKLLLRSTKTATPIKVTLQPNAEFFPSIAVAPDGTAAFYTSYDPKCGKETVKVQLVNPDILMKIGPPHIIVDCPDVAGSSTGAYGLDAVQ